MDEFAKAMKECDLCDLSKKAIAHLFRYFGEFDSDFCSEIVIMFSPDKDDSGSITYDEFLVGIRGVLNKRRKQLVHMAFDLMDKDGSGVINVDDVREVYNARSHPQVVAGNMTEEQVLTELLDNFDVGGTKDGQVTLQEFENYYSNISASVDSDDYFELMMRNAWHISGGEGWCANTTNRRVLVTHADGRQTVEENDPGLGGRRRSQGQQQTSKSSIGSSSTSEKLRGQQSVRSSQSNQYQEYQARKDMQQQQQYVQSSRQQQMAPISKSAGSKPTAMSLTATMGSISSQSTLNSRGRR